MLGPFSNLIYTVFDFTVYICPLENPTAASARLVTILVISKKPKAIKKSTAVIKKWWLVPPGLLFFGQTALLV